MPETLNEKTIDTLVKLGQKSAEAQYVTNGNVPFVLVPEGCQIKAVPELIYNEHAKTPERIKQSISVFDPDSFVNYYTLFSDPNSRVFADETTCAVVGVLDYHAAGEGSPRWGQHKLTLKLNPSEEWKIWTGSDNNNFTQQHFSEFLEQHSIDITKPSPADMLEIASDLQATTEVEFGSGLRQQDGRVRFKYSETTKTTVGAGQVSVPDRFTIELPVFVGGQRVKMEAFLRFRCKEGKLSFFYTLMRPGEVKRTAFIAARQAIAADLKITILNGATA